MPRRKPEISAQLQMEPQNCEIWTEVRATSSPVLTVSNFIEIKVYVRRRVSEVAIRKFLERSLFVSLKQG